MPDDHDDEHGDEQQRRGVLGQSRPKRMTGPSAARGADDDDGAQHEQRVGEQRADDRRLGDDDLARRAARR